VFSCAIAGTDGSAARRRAAMYFVIFIMSNYLCVDIFMASQHFDENFRLRVGITENSEEPRENARYG
jgi:hypothetical protein